MEAGMSDALAELKQQHTRLKDIWKDFHDYRANQWDPLIRRRAPQTDGIPSPMKQEMGIDVQSPDLEKALTDWLSAQLLELTKIDAFSLDNHVKAKQDVEDIRIVLAGSWGQQNDKKAISRSMFTQANRYGLAVALKTYNMPEEPDLEGVEGKDQDDKRDKYWDDYYADQNNCPFGFQPVSPLEISFWPLSNPEIVFQESKIKYVHAKDLTRDADLGGGKLTLDKAKKLHFLGDTEPEDEYSDSSDSGGPEIHVLKRAYLDKKTNRWKWDCWVRVDGAQVNESEQLEGGDCPFDRCPYFFMASGDEQVTETDPHLRFRPKIYPLLVDIQELNFWETELAKAIAARIQYPFYNRLDGMDPALLQAYQALEGAGAGLIEGQGAERRFIWRLPESASDEVPTFPALEAWPIVDLEVVRLRIEQKRMDIQIHSPNRFLTGSAFDELKNASTGTGFLNQAQAAQTTVHGDLENFDAFVEDWLQAECEAWIYWDEGAEVQKPRKYRIHGDEPVTKNPREAGDEVFINAEKLKRPFVLSAHTSNMTQQERALEDQSADTAYLQRAITKTQWLKRRGADDPEKQADELWKDDMDRMAEQLDMPIYQDQYRRFISAMTDTAPPPPMPTEGEQQGQGKPGEAGGRFPPNPPQGIHQGQAPTLGAPQGSSNGTPPGVR
jgi:hypothetical protein